MRKTVTIGGVDFDLKLTLIIILGTVLPIIDFYGHRITGTKAYENEASANIRRKKLGIGKATKKAAVPALAPK